MKCSTNRILFLGDINSPHFQKWVLALAKAGTIVGIFSFNNSKEDWWLSEQNIIYLKQSKSKQSNTLFGKLSYATFLPQLLYCIIKFKPTILHAHYASSYGLIGALTFFKPYVVSVWGSDVINFPKQSKIHKLIIKFVLWRATKICVSSTLLKREVKNYTKKPSIIIPFGIDLTIFTTAKLKKPSTHFTFGCIKHFEEIYNIDKVVEAFYLLVKKYTHYSLILVLVGNGKTKKKVEKRVYDLGISDRVNFLGFIQHKFIPQYLNTFNALINTSEYESFGVSIAEAMACKVPVIVSDIDGFKDLVPDSRNAFISKSTSIEDILKAMETCLLNAKQRNEATIRSYNLVIQNFNLINNLEQMNSVYKELTFTLKLKTPK